MRDLPADVRLAPMPVGFTAHIVVTSDGRALKWNAQVSTPKGPMRVEYGLRIPNQEVETLQRAIASITQTAWQTTELARLGRTELLAYVKTDRHTNRPGKGRELSPQAARLLADLKAAHEQRLKNEAARPPYDPEADPDEP